MEKNTSNTTDEIFPKGTGKSYALVELMKGHGPMVGKEPDDNTLFSFPVVLLIESVLFLGVTLALLLFSFLKNAPLEEIANPMVTTDPAKAPWYFLGLQEMLEHMHPTLAGIILPGILVGFLIAVPYLDNNRADIGIWFSSARGKRVTSWTAIYSLVVMPAYIALDNIFNMRELLRNVVPVWVTQWLLPALILGTLVLIPVMILKHQKATPREILLVLFTELIVSAFVFTLSGFLFRGPGFKLFWPWNMPDGYSPWKSL